MTLQQVPELTKTQPGRRIYAIGDVHGMIELIEKIFTLIHEETAAFHGRVKIVLLGDYFDRGPHSKEVMEFLLEQSRLLGECLVMLRGNHEDLLLRFVDSPEEFGNAWMQLGGDATLVSYGVAIPPGKRDFPGLRREFVRRLPLNHLACLQSLPLVYSCDDFFFSHAGARPGVALVKQSERDLLWTRWSKHESEVLFEKMVIHGHTPVDRPTACGRRINIDTGAYATGRLSAVRLAPEGIGFLTVTSGTSGKRA